MDTNEGKDAHGASRLHAELGGWKRPEDEMPIEGDLILMSIPEWGLWPYLGWVNYDNEPPWCDRDGDVVPTPDLWMLAPLPHNAEVTGAPTTHATTGENE